MRKPVVDYSKLRFSNITSPQYRHVFLLLGWVVYFALYILTEQLIPIEKSHLIHMPLDDKIPFYEGFVIFYVGWYFLIIGSLLYFLRRSVKSFIHLQTYIIITQTAAMVMYILFPTTL